MNKITKFVDSNGEIVKEDNQQFSDTMNEEGYRFPSHKSGIRFFHDSRLPSVLSYQDKGRLYDLSKEIVGVSNLIGYKKRGKIYGYTKVEIWQLVGFTDRKRGSEFFERIVSTGVIKKLDAGYYMNPAYFFPLGHRLSLELFINFQDELIPLLPKWAVLSFLSQANEKHNISIQQAEAK